ncbi:aminodeoxychorismate synthase, component I [Rhodococcus sp. ACS1]|uniref:aminodeoxychorismate synthase component I n=1 Tax=Rhodococcus sp. ACS1 TaxID=2028570 RepID=UPI000BB15EF4|nr:aminodeoxychorismate synthase component I [Rhodococcus sp. ACS1]PBC35273.1 aminodeoxychorismate synthase, component I [Rhodococcus sp. ACS1]
MFTKTLLIDNYDSFTYNLYSFLSDVNGCPPTVVRNDVDWCALELTEFDNIVISPGPGHPASERDFGISSRAILQGGLPTLGVCLGHQGLCQLFGAHVVLAPEPRHGRNSEVFHNGRELFAGLPSPLSVVRYHSLAVEDLPDELEATAWTSDGVLMGVKHRLRPLWGLQFHPESVCTDHGHELLANFRDLTPTRRKGSAPRPRRRPRTLSPYVVETQRIERRVDSQTVYERLFAHGPNSFWLDGSSTVESEARFTIMGDASGPRAEYVTYSVADGTVLVHRSGVPDEKRRVPFFDYLDEQLRVRAVPRSQDLPFPFDLGYVGYLGYELKAEADGNAQHSADTPDAALVFADRAVVIDHADGSCYLLALSEQAHDPDNRDWMRRTARVIYRMPVTTDEAHPARPLIRSAADPRMTLRHNRETYLSKIRTCLENIRVGETYEVCLTNHAQIDVEIDPVQTFAYLRSLTPVPYAALLRFDAADILSASPERFLRVGTDRVVESKPIKGTRPRGATAAADDALRQDLLTSEKDRAENLMIVDLVRNDLSRVCTPGSVHVPRLFDVETYAPVHQLVSTVRGTLRSDATAVGCVRACFPGGSMTGAPKIRTMEIIDRLEEGPRGVYSGALGWLSINGTADLSIVIRTMVSRHGTVSFGIGGAIVALSDPDEEFTETLVKAAAMRRALTISTGRSPARAHSVSPQTESATIDRAGRRLSRAELGGVEVWVCPGVPEPMANAELVLAEALADISHVTTPVVVDLCTGSGAIALAIAHARADAGVHAVDVDPTALTVARRNIERQIRLGESPIVLHETAVTAPNLLPGLNGTADLVLARPPCIPEDEDLPTQCGEYHRRPVVGGAEGLKLARQTIVAAARLLHAGGSLVVEHRPGRFTTALALLAENKFFANATTHFDNAGEPTHTTCARTSVQYVPADVGPEPDPCAPVRAGIARNGESRGHRPTIDRRK